MTDFENSALQDFLRREFENWQRQYYHDVHSLFEKGNEQELLIALERWEAGFRSFLQDRLPGLVKDYDSQTTPAIPLTQLVDDIQGFKSYKSDQIEAFLAQCIEAAGNGKLDQYFIAPEGAEKRTAAGTDENQAIKVFICYSHQDKAFTKKLAGELESQGIKVWWDYDNLQGGQDWQKEIERAIKECDFFIVILTPEAVTSEWVGNEISYANQAQKTIIPLNLKKCTIPIALIKKQYIDFEKQTQKSAIKELAGILKSEVQ